MPNAIARHRRKAFIAQDGRCFYCSRPIWEDGLELFASHHRLSHNQARLLRCTAEHLEAKCDGGRDVKSNIVAACLFCNQTRHRARDPLDPQQYHQRVRARISLGQWHSPHILAAMGAMTD